MRAFKAVDVADSCAPFEVAEWLYLGRVPEFLPDSNGHEARSSIRELTDETILHSDPYAAEELELYGLSVESETYWDAVDCDSDWEYWPKTVDDAALEWFPRFGPPIREYFHKKSIVENVESVMLPARERAQLATLLALMEGRITAYGFRLPSGWGMEGDYPVDLRGEQTDSWSDLFDRAEIAEIPKNVWRNIPEIWSYGNFESHPPNFLGCWIPTKDVFREFPKPYVAGTADGLEIRGRFGLVDSQNDKMKTFPSAPMRGRKQKGDGMLRLAVLYEFRRRLEAGELPKKKEAVLQECVDWVRATFTTEIGRSSAQRYLAELSAHK